MKNERIERNSCVIITKLGILWRQTNVKAPQNRPSELRLFRAMRTKLGLIGQQRDHYITFTFTNIGRRSVARDLPPPNSLRVGQIPALILLRYQNY